MKRPSSFALVSALGAIGLVIAPFSCGSSNSGSGFDNGDNTGDGGVNGGDGGFKNGNDGGSTIDCNVSGTVSGTAYAPNGTLPLYNVIVYAPTAPLDPLTDGVSCDKCGSV